MGPLCVQSPIGPWARPSFEKPTGSPDWSPVGVPSIGVGGQGEMAIQKNLSCFVIGSDGLLIECAQILLRQGHAIRGVVSDAPRITRWAREHGLDTIDPTKGYLEALA